MATAPTLQAEASACRSPHLLLCRPWGLLVIVFSCGSEALGLASEFSEEPLSTTEVLLINSTSDSSEPRVSSSLGSHLLQSGMWPLPCVSTPGANRPLRQPTQGVRVHLLLLMVSGVPTTRGPGVWLECLPGIAQTLGFTPGTAADRKRNNLAKVKIKCFDKVGCSCLQGQFGG